MGGEQFMGCAAFSFSRVKPRLNQCSDYFMQFLQEVALS
jgi:hypothetical protein